MACPIIEARKNIDYSRYILHLMAPSVPQLLRCPAQWILEGFSYPILYSLNPLTIFLPKAPYCLSHSWWCLTLVLVGFLRACCTPLFTSSVILPTNLWILMSPPY